MKENVCVHKNKVYICKVNLFLPKRICKNLPRQCGVNLKKNSNTFQKNNFKTLIFTY